MPRPLPLVRRTQRAAARSKIVAKVNLNPVLESIRGAIGDLVFKHYGEEVIVGRKPDPSNTPPTAGQQAVRERWKLGALYGKAVMADPVTKARYETAAKQKGIPVFALMIADFFNEPVVADMDLSAYAGRAGGTIRIVASDDFELKGVEVSIRDTNGTVLEHGLASGTAAGGDWAYLATNDLPLGQSVVIEAAAIDRPGHRGTKTVNRSA